jgi:hypothetical protein
MRELVKDRFDIDGQIGNGGVVGFHDPSDRWNGWAMPWFPIESVKIIKEWIHENSSSRITISDDGVFVMDYEDDEETPDFRGWREESIIVDGVKLFGLGRGGWVWHEERDCDHETN